MGVDEDVAPVVFWLDLEVAVLVLLVGDLVEIALDADMVETLPPMAVGRMGVIVGVSVIAILGFDGEDLISFGVGFEGSAEYCVLREPTVVSTPVFLAISLLAFCSVKVNAWTWRLDNACMAADSLL